jgi:hypothetical protein
VSINPPSLYGVSPNKLTRLLADVRPDQSLPSYLIVGKEAVFKLIFSYF